MKRAFLLWLLSISLATASNIKEDLPFSVHPVPHTIPGERFEDWDFIGNFGHTLDDYGNLIRKFKIMPLFEQSKVEKIDLFCRKGGTYGICVQTTDMINVDLFSQFTQKFGDFYLKNFFLVDQSKYFSEFLKFFYQNQYVPDCIIDLILKEFAQQKVVIDDFRLTPEKIASDLNQALTVNSCEQDIQTLLTQKLANVINPARRQDLMAWVIMSLQESNPEMSLIKTWAQEITDPSATLLYGQIKLIQSDIEMNDDVTQPDQQKRYAQALQTLLNIPSPWVTSDIQCQINLLVKYIYNNNQLNNHALPSALENLQLNAASMVNMLMYMSQLSQTQEKQKP